MANQRLISLALIAAALVAGAVSAQDNNTKPFDPALPPGGGTSSAGVVGAGPAGASAAPGAFQKDASGAAVHDLPASHSEETTDSCDASGRDRTRVHGTASAGVAAGNHVSGNYQAGTVSIDRPRGECGHSAGSLDITVGGSQSHFEDHRH